MKIGKKIEALEKDAANLLKRSTREARQAREHSAQRSNERAASVDIPVARAIQQELDPEKIEQERREKVERLKKLIAAGEYDPPRDKVAQAVGENIVLEILSNRGDDDNE